MEKIIKDKYEFLNKNEDALDLIIRDGYKWDFQNGIKIINEDTGEIIQDFFWTKVTHAKYGIKYEYFVDIILVCEQCNYWE